MLGNFDLIRLLTGTNRTSSSRGIDATSLISQLKSLQQSYTGLSSVEKVSSNPYVAKREGFARVEGRLHTLRNTAKNAQNSEQFSPMSAESADESLFFATASSSAEAGTYALSVDRLANNSTVTFGVGRDQSDSSDQGSGVDAYSGLLSDRTLTFAYNGQDYAVDLKAGETLSDVASKINKLDFGDEAGVSASLINQDGAARLIISARDSGAYTRADDGSTSQSRIDNIRITETSSGVDAGLEYGGSTVTQDDFFSSQAGQDASYSLDGITSYSSSNTVDNLVSGVTVKLNSITENDTTLTVAQDSEALKEALHSLVDAFNGVVNTLSEERRSGLSGDELARNLTSQLRDVVNSEVDDTTTSINTLAELGVQTGAGGKLEIDEDKFQQAIEQNFTAVSEVVAGNSETGTKGVAYQLDALVTELTGRTGSITARMDALSARSKSLTEQNPNQIMLANEQIRLGQVRNNVSNAMGGLGQMNDVLANTNAQLINSLQSFFSAR
ncbi:MAG: flagellar filament capping protein FliD [Magnetococcales bacterium]|nr:flagellar filament capping protein FliD [Magnetococcales bacterium]